MTTTTTTEVDVHGHDPTTLDLRQYGSLTALDLECLSSSRRLQDLTLGPYFAPGLTVTTILAALRPLPCLTRLHLNLSRVHVSDDSTIATLFSEHPTLQHLTLRMAPAMSGDALAQSVARVYSNCHAAYSCATLQSLNLHGNRMGDSGVHALVDALGGSTSRGCCSLRHLGLAHNRLTSRACSSLAKLLSTMDSCCLESLDLAYNDEIGADGFLVLVQALQVNTTLRHISWIGCRSLQPQESVVYHHLLHLLEHDNTTLTEIGLPCSFSCDSSWRPSDPSAYHRNSSNDIAQQQQQQQQNNLLDFWLQLNRTGGRHLLRRFGMNDLPMGLWPYVLARAHSQTLIPPTSGSCRPTRSNHNNNNNNNNNGTPSPAAAHNSLFFLLQNSVGRAWAVIATESLSPSLPFLESGLQ